jgi:hypothetical protein
LVVRSLGLGIGGDHLTLLLFNGMDSLGLLLLELSFVFLVFWSLISLLVRIHYFVAGRGSCSLVIVLIIPKVGVGVLVLTSVIISWLVYRLAAIILSDRYGCPELNGQAFVILGGREEHFELLDDVLHFSLIIGVVQESPTKPLADILQQLNGEVAVFVETVRGAAEGTLQRERIYQVEFLPHDYSCSWLSGFLDNEVAIIEAEVFGVFVEEHGEDPLLESVRLRVAAPIHEHVLLSRVPVIVAVEQDVSALQSLPHHHLHCEVLRTHLRRWGCPLSV